MGGSKAGMGLGSSQASTKQAVLLTPWFQNAGFQDCEQAGFCCVKHPIVCGIELWQP